MPVPSLSIDYDAVLAGQKLAVARVLNLLEDRRPEMAAKVGEISAYLSRKAKIGRHVIGITGPPGVGKSSMISRLIEQYRAQRKTVGVVSVDPSSLKSGGALLGDRIRIRHRPDDEGVFIRSLSAGGHLWGLSGNIRRLLVLFEAVYDIIILETVGVEQSETDVADVSDTVISVIHPGSGDTLQFMKAGIMEIPYILVINKADQKKASLKSYYDLKNAAGYMTSDGDQWQPEVLMTSATKNQGFEAMVAALDKHRAMLVSRDIEYRRRLKLHRCILSAVKTEYGNFGIKLLGGERRIMDALRQADIANPDEDIHYLSRQIRYILDKDGLPFSGAAE
jgi:LAO/AO transport system kinase